MAGQSQTAAAEVKDNGDNTTTISNDKGSITVDTANITNEVEGTTASTDPTENGTNTITKTGKVDYKYVTAEGNTVLEENKNQDSGADKTIETPYDVYGKSGEVFKGTTGGDAEAMYYLKQGADKDLKLVGEPTKAPGIVLGVKKGNKELQDAVNKALKELKEDGTYQKIYDKWFGDYNKK